MAFGSHLTISSPQLCEVLEYAMLASERNPTDPMERAILTLADTHLKDPKIRPKSTCIGS